MPDMGRLRSSEEGSITVPKTFDGICSAHANRFTGLLVLSLNCLLQPLCQDQHGMGSHGLRRSEQGCERQYCRPLVVLAASTRTCFARGTEELHAVAPERSGKHTCLVSKAQLKKRGLVDLELDYTPWFCLAVLFSVASLHELGVEQESGELVSHVRGVAGS